jgi:hypothetical protein
VAPTPIYFLTHVRSGFLSSLLHLVLLDHIYISPLVSSDCWGEPSSSSNGYLKQRRESDSELATPMHNAREAPLCFAESRRYQRSLDEGLKRQAKRELSGEGGHEG